MKIVLIILLCFVQSATATEILKCLGKEEAHIHKQKIGGALKSLNQAMIGEFLQLGDSAQLSKKLEEKICSPLSTYPSLFILEHSIKLSIESQSIFINKSNASTKSQSEKRSISLFNKRMFDLLLTFLTNIQSGLDDPKCLQKKFPTLRLFYQQAQYVLVEQGQKRILSNFKELPLIFSQVRSGDLNQACSKKQ